MILIVSAFGAIVSGCSAGQAPATYSPAACAGICTVSSSTSYKLICTASNEVGGVCGESNHGAEAWMISSYQTSAYENFSVYGTTNTGAAFCCFVDDSTDLLVELHLYGGSGNDRLNLVDGSKCVYAPEVGETFNVQVFGGGCNDEIPRGPVRERIHVWNYLRRSELGKFVGGHVV